MRRLSRDQVREIDRLSIERYLIPGIVLMENAAQCAADVACEMLSGPIGKEVLILCGGGNNGGDGLAVAPICTIAEPSLALRSRRAQNLIRAMH